MRSFAWYVTIPETSTEAEKYLAKLTLKNLNDDRKSLSIAQNVISMDSAPRDKMAVMASQSVMFVHWATVAGFMKWRNSTEEERQVKLSTVEATIEILVN